MGNRAYRAASSANILYRAKLEFFENSQWAELGDWEQELDQHYTGAEKMLGVNTVPFDSPADELSKDYACENLVWHIAVFPKRTIF